MQTYHHRISAHKLCVLVVLLLNSVPNFSMALYFGIRRASISSQLRARALPYRRLEGGRCGTSGAVSGAWRAQKSFALCAVLKPDFLKESEAKYFEFARMERTIYDWWEAEGYFKPSTASADEKKPFVVPMPPPNVTGYLHMGHAIFVALQDIMTRFHRMRGRPTLYLPGTDHAGIATQLLVERQLIEEGTSRAELGRDAFLDRVWQWKEEKGGYIIKQMKRLGASADWSREKFTLEPEMSEAVTEAFVKLHEKGLIYRGDYMVNWSPNLQTAVSDLEVDYSEEQGKLYYFKYELVDSEDFIPVATTRPETILGDTAVCVHPEDSRYSKFIGRSVKVPTTGRTIPVIADDYVDKEFGTGALKITPGHDPNDYEIGKRHSLPIINIMNKDASINSNGGEHRFAGMDRFECREQIWADLENDDIAIKVEPHMQRVPRSQRGGEIIEPLVSAQWFLKADDMAKRSVAVVRSGELKILPDRFEKVWYNWLENIHDWCISRQLWWGHRIPVYYVENGDEQDYFVARSLEDAQRQAEEKYGKSVTLRQDGDVLDTWFSSGLWPFATVGWPQSVEAADSDFKRFYPATVLETGYDILFFWVARMVMMGLELTDKVPFDTIYLHGLVRDGQGQKMSKTKGNVIDPIDTIDQLGADALRYSLVTGSTPGQDVPLSMEKIESNRNFANKLWNAGKYIKNCLGSHSTDDDMAVVGTMNKEQLSTLALPERYIVSRCHQLVEKVTEALENYNFGDAGRQIYEFLWDEFADWYIEASKARMRSDEINTGTNSGGLENGSDAAQSQTRQVLTYVWDTCMRLLHPFMPFLTESLWQTLPHKGDSLMVAPWPQLGDDALPVDNSAISLFNSFQSLVRAIRNARAEYNVDPGKKVAVILRAPVAMQDLVRQEQAVFSLLGRVDPNGLSFLDSEQDLPGEAGACVHIIVEDGVEMFLPQSGLIDKEKERNRLQKQSEKLKKDIGVLQGRLQNPSFVERAPEHLVAEARSKLRDMEDQLRTVASSMESLV